MSQINDAINAAIPDSGALNDLADKLLRFYQANGAVSLDLQDAEYQFLVARGAAPVLGVERVQNGTFTSGASWTPGTGWTISGNAARIDGSQVTFSMLQNTGVFAGSGQELIQIDIQSIVPTAGLGVEVDDGATAFTPVYTTPGRMRMIGVIAGPPGPIAIKAAPGVKAVITALSVQDITALNSGTNKLQDMWEWYLRTVKGYTGALDDMRLQYWTTGPRP